MKAENQTQTGFEDLDINTQPVLDRAHRSIAKRIAGTAIAATLFAGSAAAVVNKVDRDRAPEKSGRVPATAPEVAGDVTGNDEPNFRPAPVIEKKINGPVKPGEVVLIPPVQVKNPNSVPGDWHPNGK